MNVRTSQEGSVPGTIHLPAPSSRGVYVHSLLEVIWGVQKPPGLEGPGIGCTLGAIPSMNQPTVKGHL